MYKFLNMFFNSVWDLFSLKWPGFDFSIGTVFLGAAFALVALRIFGKLFSMHIGFGGSAASVASKIKISASRRNDEK